MNRFAARLLVILVGISVGAFGCECASRGAERPCRPIKDSSEVIFVGKLLSVENPPDDSRTADEDIGEARYTFGVEESLAGVTTGQLDIFSGRGGGDCSVRFTVGEKYLIDAWRGEDRRVSVSTCSRTRPLVEAGAVLPQLRAMRDGRRPDSLFGTLWRDEPSEGDYNQYLAGRTIHLRSPDRMFETKTDAAGRYRFPDLPPAEYAVSVDLPPSFVLIGDAEDLPPKPLVVAANACGEYDFIALPTGQISGRVIAANGRQIEDRPAVGVMLFRADRYVENPSNWYRWANLKNGNFLFKHVASGDYFVVYNYKDRIDERHPFAKTFYPSATDPDHASRVHLDEGKNATDIVISVRPKTPSHD